MKKILICLPSLSCSDGIAKVIMSNYNNLIEKNFQIDFLLVLNNKIKNEYEECIKKNNGKIFILPKHSKFTKYLTTRKFLKYVFKDTKYDIIHVNLIDRYAYACMTGKCNDSNIIYHVHNPKSKSKLGVISKILNKLCIKKAKLLVACSTDAGFSMFGKNKFYILNNSIDIEKYKFSLLSRNKIRKKLNINDNTLLIGTIARITEQKNPIYALNVIKECINANENLYYLWIGNGNQKNKVEKHILENETLKDHVLLLEEIDDVQEYYSAMDIFVLPSKFEGLGIVAIEAQASGVPVLVSTNFPKETKITDLIKYIDIQNENITEWKECILGTKKDLQERINYNELLKKNIFNIDNLENKLSYLYEIC